LKRIENEQTGLFNKIDKLVNSTFEDSLPTQQRVSIEEDGTAEDIDKGSETRRIETSKRFKIETKITNRQKDKLDIGSLGLNSMLKEVES